MYKIFTPIGVIDLVIPSTRPSEKGEIEMICPICTPMRQPEHRNEKKLSVNVNKMAWRCNHCGNGGNLHTDIEVTTMKLKPIFHKDNRSEISVSDKFVQWFWDRRRISINTLNDFKITLSMESIRQDKVSEETKQYLGKFVNRKCINYKYFWKGILYNIKFRDPNKNFKLIKDGTLIMYNLDSIKDQKYCVIVEGENDCMAYHEAGITPVVSVPNGATITPQEKEHYEKTGKLEIHSQLNLTYLDNCIDAFDDKETIYLATDDDAPGVKLREELARRFGKERCKYIQFSKWKDENGNPINDPNELLIKHGKEALASSLNFADSYPVEDVSHALDYWDDLKMEFREGRQRALSSGYKSLDPHWGWVPGWTTAINGYPSSGKSFFAFNLIAISIIKYNYNWGLYCPENYPPRNIVNILSEIIIGNTMDPRFNDRMDFKEFEIVINSIIQKRIHFVDREKGFTPEELRERKKSMIRQYGINGFFTDPWTNLIHDYSNKREDQYLERELSEEIRLSTRTGLINLIAVHPPTPIRDKSKEYPAPTIFEITGGKIWAAKVYSVICVHPHKAGDYENNILEVHIQRNKEEKIGGIKTDRNNPILLHFNFRTGRLFEKQEGKGDLAGWSGNVNDFTYYPIPDDLLKNEKESIEGF